MGIIARKVYFNLDNQTLTQQTLDLGQGKLNDLGALCVTTGKFTGRSPKDKFIVKDSITAHTIDWGDVNLPISEEVFHNLFTNMKAFLQGKYISVIHFFACTDRKYRVNVTVR